MRVWFAYPGVSPGRLGVGFARCARQVVRRGLAEFDAATAQPPIRLVISGEDRVVCRRVVRSAAAQVAIRSLYLQRLRQAVTVIYVVSFVPLCYAPVLFLSIRWRVTESIANTILDVLFVGVVAVVLTVAVQRYFGSIGFFWAVIGCLLAAAPIIASSDRYPGQMVVVTAATLLVPALFYGLFVALVPLSFIVSWITRRRIDPRATVIIALLDCIYYSAVKTSWVRTRPGRQRYLAMLELAARSAERDLGRIVTGSASDPATRDWARSKGRGVAASIRQLKHIVVDGNDDLLEQLGRAIGCLFVSLCAGKWPTFDGESRVSRAKTLAATALKRLATSAVLIGVGFVIPVVFSNVFEGTKGTTFFLTLTVSGLLALVPLPRDSLNPIPETLRGLMK
jgi:hypothetical protein